MEKSPGIKFTETVTGLDFHPQCTLPRGLRDFSSYLVKVAQITASGVRPSYATLYHLVLTCRKLALDALWNVIRACHVPASGRSFSTRKTDQEGLRHIWNLYAVPKWLQQTGYLGDGGKHVASLKQLRELNMMLVPEGYSLEPAFVQCRIFGGQN